MSELIPCPFCGWEFAEHAWNEFGEEYRVCDQCGASSGTVDSKWDWNNRPIEDALEARIAELEHRNKVLEDACEMLRKENGRVTQLLDFWKGLSTNGSKVQE